MRRRHLRIALITLGMAALGACGVGAPGASLSSSTPAPVATSFEEYAVSFCAAFDAMFRAVGNPDTAAGSELSKALDAAVATHDGSAAEPLAAEITTELELGRHHVAQAGGWPPAAPVMAQLDRVFMAFEAMTAAKLAAAQGEPDAVDPQAAFEQAGGVEAWFAMFDLGRTIQAERPAEAKQCANVPVSP